MNNNDNKAEQVKEFVIDEFGHFFDRLGAKGLIGRIWALLLSEKESVSLKTIASKLRVSKPAVSATLQSVEYMEIFEKRYNPDFPRENFYELKYDSLDHMVEAGDKKMKMIVATLSATIQKIENIYEGENKPEEIKTLCMRLNYMLNVYKIFDEEYAEFGRRAKERILKIKKNK